MNKVLGPDTLASMARGPSIDSEPPRSALAICAHPDDPDFFVAGTFAKWAEAGTVCTYVVCTDGSAGSWDELGDDLSRVRRAEQEAAARTVGARDVVFLDHPDGFLRNTLELRRELVAVIREVRPDALFTHDPWKRWRLHPDHRECGFAACDAAATAREPRSWPETGRGAHRPGRLWLFETEEPDRFEDISSTIQAKVAALLEHRSQWPTTMGIADEHDSDGMARFAARIRAWAAKDGSPEGLSAAEAFRSIDV